MRKIATCFERDWDNNPSRVLTQIHSGCEWVFDGGDVKARRKYDGVCIYHDGRDWWARREVKAGKEAPAGFLALETDPETNDTVGWQPIVDSPFYKFFLEALPDVEIHLDDYGTYELCGPKVNKNMEGFDKHVLVRHQTAETAEIDFTFTGMKEALETLNWEGFVFYGGSGIRLAKIKGRDFGLKRQVPTRTA